MNLLRFAEPVTVAFKKSAGGATVTFEANRDYVIANSQLERIMQDQNIRNRAFKISKLESRLPNFNVSARKAGNQRLLIFNGSGGYGDQIMTWPVAKLLASMGYEIHVMTDPGNNVCWWNFPWVKTVNTCPMPFEQVKMYDYVLIFEAVVNMDEHQDQEHPVDTMLRKIGIDPASVDASLKVTHPMFSYLEMESTKKFDGKQIGLFQLSAANPVRCLQPADSVFMLMKLAQEFPDIHWLALYDEFVNVQYKELCEAKLKEAEITNAEAYSFGLLRELWAMTTKALIVIAPDSMMAHISGSCGIPCVGLWGPVAPGNRVRYYKNHRPVWHQKVCPHSPCFAYTNTFPKYCPPRPTPRTTCEVLAAISPADVISEAKIALGRS